MASRKRLDPKRDAVKIVNLKAVNAVRRTRMKKKSLRSDNHKAGNGGLIIGSRIDKAFQQWSTSGMATRQTVSQMKKSTNAKRYK